MRLRFERYYDDGRSISRNVASLNILVHDVINLLYYYLLIETKFTYSPLGKPLEKHKKKQIDALKSLTLSDKTNELKQKETIFR